MQVDMIREMRLDVEWIVLLNRMLTALVVLWLMRLN